MKDDTESWVQAQLASAPALSQERWLRIAAILASTPPEA